MVEVREEGRTSCSRAAVAIRDLYRKQLDLERGDRDAKLLVDMQFAHDRLPPLATAKTRTSMDDLEYVGPLNSGGFVGAVRPKPLPPMERDDPNVGWRTFGAPKNPNLAMRVVSRAGLTRSRTEHHVLNEVRLILSITFHDLP